MSVVHFEIVLLSAGEADLILLEMPHLIEGRGLVTPLSSLWLLDLTGHYQV